MNENIQKTFNRVRWLSIIFLFAAILIDWLFIFSISQEANIITHLVIVLPMVLSLFFFFVLMAFVGMYLVRWWGFFIAYILIITSVVIAIVTYNTVPREMMTGLSYLVMLVLGNSVISGYILFFQWYEKKCVNV